jgi:hypothetical protein
MTRRGGGARHQQSGPDQNRSDDAGSKCRNELLRRGFAVIDHGDGVPFGLMSGYGCLDPAETIVCVLANMIEL